MHLRQVQVITEVVHRQATVVAEVTAVAEAVEEAAVVHTLVGPVVVPPAAVLQVGAVDVLPEVVLLHPGADNFRKQIKFRFN